MIPVLTFDLETIPDVAGLRRVRPQWQELGDREIVAAAWAERKEKTGSEFLPPHLHRIVAIGCAFRDATGLRVKCIGAPEDDEAQLVRDFFRLVDRYTPQLVSWNGGGFDLPVLHYRALIHGIPAARYWEQGEGDREFRFNHYLGRYHARHTDLMDVLAMYQGRAMAPLDELARLCGFAGKIGIGGDRVWDTWCEGGIQRIRDYCEADVINTWLLWCRFEKIRGHLDAAQYEAEEQVVRDLLAALPGEHGREFLRSWDAAPGR